MDVTAINSLWIQHRLAMQNAYQSFATSHGKKIQDVMNRLKSINEELTFTILVEGVSYRDDGRVSFYWDVSLNDEPLEDLEDTDSIVQAIENEVISLEGLDEEVMDLIEELRQLLVVFEELEGAGQEDCIIKVDVDGVLVKMNVLVNGRHTIED